MRLSDLLGSEVFDRAGARVGTVVDVRLVQDGPPQESGRARLRVAGLAVSPRHAGRMLGYEREPEPGPWLIRVLVRRFNRGTLYVPWEWAEVLDDRRVRVSRPAAEVPRLRDLTGPPA